MNTDTTLRNVNDALRRGDITVEEGDALLKKAHPKTSCVYCVDANQFKQEKYCWFSFFSKKWYYSDWACYKVTRRDENGKLVESRCHNTELKQHAFFCTLSELYYANVDFTKVIVEGENVCLEANIDKLDFENEKYYYKFIIPDDKLDDEGRACYHSMRRLSSRHQGIGVELEIDVRQDIYGLCSKARKFGIFAEADGSLEYEGVELIGPIASFEDYVKWKHWGPIFDCFKEHKCVGYDAGEDYGIHVSLSLSLFSDLDLSKFVLFFNTCSKLCKCVAQRDEIYNGDYGAQISHKRFKQTLTDKYEAVKIDTVRAEVRIFRSTVRKDRFLKNIEFCEAVRHAIKKMSAATVLRQEEATEAFITYLIKERKTYPNLYQFLIDKKFIKNAPKKKAQNKNYDQSTIESNETD